MNTLMNILIKILKQIKKIIIAIVNIPDDRVAIIDIIPKNWEQVKKLIMGVTAIFLGLAIYTLVLSFFI